MKKQKDTYYLAVEGACEKAYFQHLQNLINQSDQAERTVKIDAQIRTPISLSKRTNASSSLPIYYVIDMEGEDSELYYKFLGYLDNFNSVKGHEKN